MARTNPKWWTRWGLVAALAGLAGGCVAAAAAGAGAGAGIYLTSGGVGSLVKGSVDVVAERTRAVLEADGVTITETTTVSEGDKRIFKGTKGELEITVELQRESPSTTKAEVTARKKLVVWDKDYARTLLKQIVAQS